MSDKPYLNSILISLLSPVASLYSLYELTNKSTQVSHFANTLENNIINSIMAIIQLFISIIVLIIVIYFLSIIGFYKLSNSIFHTIFYCLFGIFFLPLYFIYYGFSGYRIRAPKLTYQN